MLPPCDNPSTVSLLDVYSGQVGPLAGQEAGGGGAGLVLSRASRMEYVFRPIHPPPGVRSPHTSFTKRSSHTPFTSSSSRPESAPPSHRSGDPATSLTPPVLRRVPSRPASALTPVRTWGSVSRLTVAQRSAAHKALTTPSALTLADHRPSPSPQPVPAPVPRLLPTSNPIPSRAAARGRGSRSGGSRSGAAWGRMLAAARGKGSARGEGQASARRAGSAKEDNPQASRLEELIRSGECTDVDDSSSESMPSGEMLRHLEMLDAGTSPADSSSITHRLQVSLRSLNISPGP